MNNPFPQAASRHHNAGGADNATPVAPNSPRHCRARRSLALIPLVLSSLIFHTSPPPAHAAPPTATATSPTLTIAVAANAAPLVKELAARYTAATGVPVTLSTGATGMLARQAREGAPFDLFVGADMERVEALAKDGIVDPATVAPYAKGVLCLWQPRDARHRYKSMPDLQDQVTTLAPATTDPKALASSPVLPRLAIGNPQTAPYGQAAKQALARRNLWLILEPSIVISDDVGQALQVARTGNVDGAFVPASLASLRPASEGTSFTLAPTDYPEIRQGLGVLARSPHKPQAQAFRDLLLGPEATATLHSQGYQPPN